MAGRGRPKKKQQPANPKQRNESDKPESSISHTRDEIEQEAPITSNAIQRDLEEAIEQTLPDGIHMEEGPEVKLDAEPISYAEAVGKVDCKLTYIEAEEMNGNRYARITEDDIVTSATYWDSAAVVCILGANPPLSIAEGFIRRIWKAFSIDEIKFSKPGQYVVRFHSEDKRDEAISRTYYQFDNKPVYVRKWKPGCTIDLNALNDIPIWVQLPDLELKYWSLSGLSKIGSLLGKPIRTDNATATKTKMEYARLQVAVAMNQQFPDRSPAPIAKGKDILKLRVGGKRDKVNRD
ncbi:unnamed protein product [Cuscuta campestris]|uniref:DUF4283 domain-containing protein n=1 Tax=Cuscuta campestris TaxID=132261 RepID=A0A484MQ37_9ASTE|nr:unnamed protein product [Cuscuta campestris]